MDKPAYRVPTMAEVRAVPWNGFNVVSTFSGAGGSSLGYRMAGYRVLWASEFIPAARAAYEANKAPYTIVDPRDIRTVSASDILEATGLKPGELDLFDGSPPCSAFTTMGRREKFWGKVKDYSEGVRQRADDLFFEYARLLRELQPKTFVAENVPGLIKGNAKGYFKSIVSELKACGYRVKAAIVSAAGCGIPQLRERLIFVGVREDLGLDPVFPTPLPYVYTLVDIFPEIKNSRCLLEAGFHSGKKFHIDRPCPTISSNGLAGTSSYALRIYDTDKKVDFTGHEYDFDEVRIDDVAHSIENQGRRFTINELRALCSFPFDYDLAGNFVQSWERMGRAVPPLMMKAISETVAREILSCAV